MPALSSDFATSKVTAQTSQDVDTMYKAMIVSGLAAILAGCATAEPVPLPSGRQGYAIEHCHSVSMCYKKAAEVCGGPYDVVDQHGKTITTVSGSGGVVSGGSAPVYALVIECKSPS